MAFGIEKAGVDRGDPALSAEAVTINAPADFY
jgi:hypothetical protein